VIAHNLECSTSSRDAVAKVDSGSCRGRATHASKQIASRLRRRRTSEKLCSTTVNRKQSDWAMVVSRLTKTRLLATAPTSDDVSYRGTVKSTGSSDDVLASMSVCEVGSPIAFTLDGVHVI